MKKFILFLCLMILGAGIYQIEDGLILAAIIYLAYIVSALLVLIAIKLRFTIVAQNDNEITLLHYKGNKVRFYEKPVWGKPRRTTAKLPNNLIRDIKGGERQTIETDFTIEMGLSITALIPVKIEYRFSGPFKASDLQAKLKINTPKKAKARIISGLNIFKPVIKTSCRDTLKVDIIRWNNRQLSHLDLAQRIIAQVDFPEKFFSNMKKIKVEISAPKLAIRVKNKDR